MGTLLPMLAAVGALVGLYWAYMNVKSSKGIAPIVGGAALALFGAGFVAYFTTFISGETGVMVSDVLGGFLVGLGSGIAVVGALKETLLK